MTFSHQGVDQQVFISVLMILSKTSSGVIPHRKSDKQTRVRPENKGKAACMFRTSLYSHMMCTDWKTHFHFALHAPSQFRLFSAFKQQDFQVRDYLSLFIWPTRSTKHHISLIAKGVMTIVANLQILILNSHCQNNAIINTNKIILLKIFMEKLTLMLIFSFFVLFSKKTASFSKTFAIFY